MNCGNCGNDNVKGSDFCSSCGTQLNPIIEPTSHPQPPPQHYAPRGKLYRSRKNRLVAGVCGGIGEHYDVDPTIIRLLWVILLLSGVGFFAYLIAIVLIPESPFDPWVEPR